MLGEAEICPVCKRRLTLGHREKVKDELQEEIGLLKKRLKGVKRDLRKHDLQKREVEREIEQVSKVDVERIERLRKEIAENRKEVTYLHNTLYTIIQLVDHLKSDINAKISAIDAKIYEIEGILKKLVEEIGYMPEDPEEELKGLRAKKEEYDHLKPIADKYNEIKQTLGKKQENLKEIEAERKKIHKAVRELGYDEKKHGETRKRYEELLEKFGRTKAELEEKKKLLEKNQRDLEKLERKIAELEKELDKIKSDLEKTVKFIGYLNNIRGAFSRDGVQKLLRQKVAPLVSEFARKYIESFNLDIMDIFVNEDFDISIIKESGEIPIKSISGGEKVAVAIALRLAIAKALAGKISTIIMDEPTTHLDEERRRELVEIMKSFFRKEATIPQMIIITHHRELEDVADTVYQVEKIDGVSRVT